MTKFVVLFEDNPGTGAEVRKKHMPDHLAFLQRHADSIEAAGPLLAADGEMAGGLWLVEAPDRDDVQALVEEDPFWSTGLRKAVRIRKWRQVFANGTRLIAI